LIINYICQRLIEPLRCLSLKAYINKLKADLIFKFNKVDRLLIR